MQVQYERFTMVVEMSGRSEWSEGEGQRQ